MIVRPITPLDEPTFAALRDEARATGVTFIDRLARDWEDGTNRFDAPGERYLGAFESGALVGCGGLNVDPYANDPALGRIRHVYVRAGARRRGVGKQLLGALLDHARSHFTRVRLKTETVDAVMFYESLGFTARAVESGYELARDLS